MKQVNFWNGNKSIIRQEYELAILRATLYASTHDEQYQVVSDVTDYPDAKDEGNIFDKGTDLLVTVAGNLKFSGKSFIPVNIPLAKGLLGYRVLITRTELLASFHEQSAIKSLRAGFPATWADAELFRANEYNVVEKGGLADIFQRLSSGECDYVSLGANEVQSIFNHMASEYRNLVIEPNIVLYYPFPLLFYVHPERPQLASMLKCGLEKIIHSGELDTIFERFFGDCAKHLNLSERKLIALTNPILPPELVQLCQPSI